MDTAAVLPHIRGVVFDMDGTLTDSPLDFDRIREECGVPPGQPILEFMESADEDARGRILAVLDRHETDAALACTLRSGARCVTDELKERGMRTALLTRNSARAVETVLGRFGLTFDVCIARDDAEPKPSPQPVRLIARRLDLEPHELLMVGDYVFDMQAGRAAGAATVLVRSPKLQEPPPEADYVIDDLTELLTLVPADRDQEPRHA
jgi:HAD superfamily hydrolase (TIGR01509 family)